MGKYVYQPKCVCSKVIEFEIEDDTIRSLKVTVGCSCNLRGISSILRGKSVDEVIEAFDGIQCGNRPTSCPDQIAQALKNYKTQE